MSWPSSYSRRLQKVRRRVARVSYAHCVVATSTVVTATTGKTGDEIGQDEEEDGSDTEDATVLSAGPAAAEPVSEPPIEDMAAARVQG